MLTAVFKKKVTPKNGNKPFNKYITTLHNRNGEPVYCDVHFTGDAGTPTKFPCNIEFRKQDANLQTRTINEGTENERTVHNLWISRFKESEYIDSSLDEFE